MSEKHTHTRTIAVDLVARVEGEGALRVTVKGDAVQDVQLKIFEPPRFFEAFCRVGITTKCLTSSRGSAGSARLPTR